MEYLKFMYWGQINLQNAWVIKDDLEYPMMNVFRFGCLGWGIEWGIS